MRDITRLWVISFFKPILVFRLFRSYEEGAARFTWWTTIFIYVIAYFSLFSIFLGFSAVHLGALVFFLVFVVTVSLTLVKNYFYTLILSYKTKSFVSYQDVCLISALSDAPLILGFPILYAVSLQIGGGIVFIVLLLFLFFLLRSRCQLFQNFYGVSAKFVYGISFGIWANIIILFFLFVIYIGISVQLLLHYLSILG